MFRKSQKSTAPGNPDPTEKRSHSWSGRRKLLVGALVALVILAFALGLGLGLTIGRDHGSGNDNDDGPETTPTSSPLASPASEPPWLPKPNDTWQIILQNNIILSNDSTSITPNVSIFDIDLFDNTADTIATLHRLGKKVICYFSAGSYEPGRPDSGEFLESDKGKGLDGWPGERWLVLNSSNVRQIMEARIKLAAEKGCDGVDPDNVDGYQNDNGLGLTADSSVSFIAYLSNLTAPLNLTLGLKNAGSLIPTVLPVVHFSVNEQCVANSECDVFHQFVDADKPVFHIEYPSKAGKGNLKQNVVKKFCGDGQGDGGNVGEGQGDGSATGGFSTVLKSMDLDGWVEYCDGSVSVTAVNGTDSD